MVPILPLIVTRSLFFPFITGRNFIFRIIIEVLLILWLWLIMTEPEKYRPRSSAIVYSFVVLIGILFLATIFGISPYKSFWSSFERMEGFWGMWHYLIYFLILISVFKKESDWFKFFFVSLGASVVMSFYALLQFLGKLGIHQGDVRLDATLGNATYLAIYLVFHVFLSGYFFFKTRNIWLRIILSLVAVFELIMAYHTATRGATIGFIAGLILFALINSIWSSGRTRKIALAILIAAVLIPPAFIIVKNTSFVQNSEVLNRFANISFNETTTQSRFIIWNMAYQAWKERPVLGWGPESFVYIFSKYYDARMWRQEPWFDRAHNVFFDWLTSAGLVGLLAYLSLFGSGVWTLFKLFKSKVLKIELAGVIAGLLLAYFIHNIFVFDNFASYFIFFAVLAYIHWLYKNQSGANENSANNSLVSDLNSTVKMVVMGVTSVAVIFSLYFFNVKPIMASKSIIDSLSLLTYSRDGSRVRDLGEGIKALKRGIDYNTFGTTEIREQLSQYAERIDRDPATSSEDKKIFLKFALDEAKKQEERFPYDVRAKAFLSTVYGLVGDNVDSILIAQKGLAVSSQRQQFYFLLGEAYFRAGQEDLAMETLKQAYELAPDYPDAISNYAMILIFSGYPKEAEALVKKHFGTEIIADAKYINAYVAIGQFDKVVLIWEKLAAQEPNNANYRLSLASAYVKTWQDKKAIEQLEKAIELAPDFKIQGEIFIKQIKEGKLKR